jgi:hypothetical protein
MSDAWRRASALVLALGALACGTSSAGSAGAGVDAAADGDADLAIGDVAGTSFVVRSSFARNSAPPSGYAIAEVHLTTQSGVACGAVHDGAMTLSLFVYDPTEHALVAAGTYPVGATTDGGLSGDAYFHAYSGACREVLPVGAPPDGGFPRGGSITLSSVSPRMTGTFDVTVDGVHLAGAFDAPLCDPDAGTLAPCE